MTYAELFAAARALAPSRSINISVETWLHVHGEHSSVATEWTVYTIETQYCTAATPEEALTLFAGKLNGTRPAEMSLDAVSAAVADAPTCESCGNPATPAAAPFGIDAQFAHECAGGRS